MAGRKSEVDRVALALSKKAFIGKGPIDFEHVLYDPVNLKYFKDFCVSEMSTENLLFWLEVEDYKDIKEAAINMRLFTARKIARKYIDASATQQLGIEDRYKTAIMEGLKLPEPPPHLFTEAQQQIFVSMKTDSFPRFLESQMYKELIAIKLEDRKVVDMKDFDLYRFLGAGGFGMVLLTQMTATKKYYATKVIDKRILISQNQTHSIFREKEVLALVEHPFIVALRYAFQTEDHLCFVLDFIEGGNMYSDLMRGPYTHKRAVFYTAQIVLATEHLHELDILYRDLKPDNVLLTIDGHVKLADMGAARGTAEDGSIGTGETASAEKTAKAQDPSRGRRMTITGTHGYRAPEVYDRDYGKAADWWNVGILIIEMLTAENPLRGENRRESEYLTKHKELSLPAYVKESAKKISLAFLNRDPTKRLGCVEAEGGVAQIKAHEFFTSLECDAPKIKGLDWEKLMAMEHPVRRRACHSKGGARLARLRLGRPRHPRLPHSHPPPSPPLRSAGALRVGPRVRGAREARRRPHPRESGDGRRHPARLLLPDGRLHEDLDVDAHDVAAQA